MSVRQIVPGTWVDPSMEDGWVRVEPRDDHDICPPLFMTEDTFYALSHAGRLMPVTLHMLEQPQGEYLIPPRVLLYDPEVAEDLQRVVDLGVDRGDSCVMPGCLQDPIDAPRDFAICEMHDAMLSDVDDLLAV